MGHHRRLFSLLLCFLAPKNDIKIKFDYINIYFVILAQADLHFGCYIQLLLLVNHQNCCCIRYTGCGRTGHLTHRWDCFHDFEEAFALTYLTLYLSLLKSTLKIRSMNFWE